MKSAVELQPWSFKRNDCTLEGLFWKPRKWHGSAVVLLHGFARNRYNLAKYAQNLAEQGYLCIAYDARGHGMTGGLLDTKAMIDDIGAVVESLYFDHGAKAVGLLGHSMGGWVSTIAAAEHDGIDAVALLSGAVDPIDDLKHSSLAHFGGTLLERLDDRGTGMRVPKFLKANPPDGEEVPYLTDLNLARMYRVFKEAPDARLYAPRITLPFFSVHGTRDELVPYAAAENLYEVIASEDKEIIRVEKAKHQLHRTQYARFAPRVLEFFDKWL